MRADARMTEGVLLGRQSALIQRQALASHAVRAGWRLYHELVRRRVSLERRVELRLAIEAVSELVAADEVSIELFSTTYLPQTTRLQP